MKKTLLLFTLGASTWGFAQPQRPSQDGERPNNSDTKEVAPRLILKNQIPEHWGKPMEIQTKDFRPLPGGFGMGSSTLASWIKENIAEDKENGKFPDRKPDDLSDIEKQDPKKIERETLRRLRKENSRSRMPARNWMPSARKWPKRRVQTPCPPPTPRHP